MSGKFIGAAVAGLLGSFCFQQAFGAEEDVAGRAIWREAMSHNPESGPGCFQAAYPSYVWERTQCKVVHRKMHRAPQKPTFAPLFVTGNGNDYVVQGTGLISETIGSFPTV